MVEDLPAAPLHFAIPDALSAADKCVENFNLFGHIEHKTTQQGCLYPAKGGVEFYVGYSVRLMI